MPNAAGQSSREPVSPHNAVLLLVDQQVGLLSRVHEPERTLGNLLALARCAQLLGIPAVMTTALAAGPNGPQLNELTETFPDQEVIDRCGDHGHLPPMSGDDRWQDTEPEPRSTCLPAASWGDPVEAVEDVLHLLRGQPEPSSPTSRT